MAKTRTTLTVDEDVLRAVRIKAARSGKRDSEVIEESLRRDLGLDELERIWARVKPAPEKEGLDLAYAELHAMREEQDAAGGTR
jgi:gamma-glutamyl:cysteine ligase YbdK (ATP-grasp superfamily)